MTGFSPSTSVFPCQYHSTIAPYSFIHLPPFFFLFLRRYNFREVLAFSTSFFHLVRFLMQSFHFVIFILVISLFTSSSHLFLGLPSDLVIAGDHSYTFLPCCYLAYDVRVRTKLILCFDVVYDVLLPVSLFSSSFDLIRHVPSFSVVGP